MTPLSLAGISFAAKIGALGNVAGSISASNVLTIAVAAAAKTAWTAGVYPLSILASDGVQSFDLLANSSLTVGAPQLPIVARLLAPGASATSLITPTGSPAMTSTISTPSAAASIVLKSSSGSLASFAANSSSATWLLLFDAASVPADGAVTPIWSGMLIAGMLSGAWPEPLAYANGLTAAFSSTGPFLKTSGPTGFISAQIN